MKSSITKFIQALALICGLDFLRNLSQNERPGRGLLFLADDPQTSRTCGNGGGVGKKHRFQAASSRLIHGGGSGNSKRRAIDANCFIHPRWGERGRRLHADGNIVTAGISLKRQRNLAACLLQREEL